MEIFDNVVEYYDQWFEKNDNIFASELAAVKELMPKFDAEKAISIGVGTGRFAEKLGIKIGVEPSRPMADLAEKRGIDVHIASAEDLPFNDESFELVTMITVECFIKEVDKACQEIYRVLEPGGKFLMAMIDRETELGRQYEELKDEDEIYQHAEFRSSEEVLQRMAASKLKVLDTRQTIYTLDNIRQESKEGTGEGVFVVILAEKID